MVMKENILVLKRHNLKNLGGYVSACLRHTDSPNTYSQSLVGQTVTMV